MTTKTKILLIAAAALLIGCAVTAFVLKPWESATNPQSEVPQSEAGQSLTTDGTNTSAPTVTDVTAATPDTDNLFFDEAVEMKMTMEILEAMNEGGEMPEVRYNEDGTINRISTRAKDERTNNISPFPVFDEHDARILIDNYLNLFEINEDVDIRLTKHRTMMNSNIFTFNQYYNDLKIDGNMVAMVVSTDKETGFVYSMFNGYLPNLDIESTPQISLEEAKQIIVSELDTNIDEQYKDPELFIYYDRNTVDKPELVWKIYTAGGYITWVQLSAITGEILLNGEVMRAGPGGVRLHDIDTNTHVVDGLNQCCHQMRPLPVGHFLNLPTTSITTSATEGVQLCQH
jgi:hypothetical protein